MNRFWVLGPVEIGGCEKFGVVDGYDLPGQQRAAKPSDYQEFWPSQDQVQSHADKLNGVTPVEADSINIKWHYGLAVTERQSSQGARAPD